jgi:hypothetical protein
MWNVIKGLEKEKYDYLLRSVYSPENSDDFHNQFTPYQLCAEIVGKVGIEIDEQKRWLIIANLEFVIVLKRYFAERKWNFDTVTFATPCDTKAEVAKILGIKNIVKYSYEKLKEWQMSEKKKEFDVIIGNPPYKKGLHLVFLEESIKMLSNSGKLIFIHPSEWLIQLKENGKGKKYNTLRTSLSSFVKSIEFRSAFLEMNIGMYAPLCILFLDKNKISTDLIYFENNCPPYGKKNISKLSFSCKALSEINPWANANDILEITNKICLKNNIRRNIRQPNGSFFVNLSNFSGNGSVELQYYDGIIRKTLNMFNIINNTSNFVSREPLFAKAQNRKHSVHKKTTGKEKSWVAFKTEIEAINFLKFVTKSKLIKFLITIYKIDQYAYGIFEYLPFLDFSQEWTDDKIADYYKFTSKDLCLINNVIEKISM